MHWTPDASDVIFSKGRSTSIYFPTDVYTIDKTPNTYVNFAQVSFTHSAHQPLSAKP